MRSDWRRDRRERERARAHAALRWLAALVLMLGVAGTAEARNALLVASSTVLGSGDEVVARQLELRGWTVTVVDDNAVQTSDATGMDLVIVSGTVGSGNVAGKFTSVSMPVICWESFIFDDMGWTGSSSSDLGFTDSQTELDIVGTHPLTAGLSGTITMTTEPERTTWGLPGPSAVVAATEAGNSAHVYVFGYEAGASMVVGTAAARRVGLFLGDFVPGSWTADTVDLFEAAVAWAMNDPEPDPVRILHVGDSITGANSTYHGFRPPLWDLLVNDGCEIDFTGTLDQPDDAIVYDQDHQGYAGYRTDEMIAVLPNDLLGNAPDYALVHLGTNDVIQAIPTATIKENLRTLIGQLRVANPDVQILLAQVIPNTAGNDPGNVALNAAIAALAGEETTLQSPITLVDHYTRYDPVALNDAGLIHPTDLGYAEMTARWYTALHPLISGSCSGAGEEPPPPPPPPVPSLSAAGLASIAALLALCGVARTRRRR